ncbi:MAG: hypothetical protein GY862_03900 [Gammaproteobacteria bacterium]|nr:hypothetical protein [Gammaproteobacteria bacterium]
MNTLAHSEPAPTLEEVWRLFRETDRLFKETSQEADRRFKEASQEADRRFKETERALKESFQETERQFRQTDRKLNKLERLFNSQWGKLVECLVEGALIKVFNERGIPIQHTVARAHGVYEGNPWELDIIAKNGHEVIIVEVKTTLRPDDVKNFLTKLKRVKQWMSEYAGNTVYGAMAWITADAGAEKMTQNQGLFCIKAVGDSARIENEADFTPRAY